MPPWFKAVWGITDAIRKGVSRFPFGLRRMTTTAIAGAVYWPLARLARIAEGLGVASDAFPLSAYKYSSFYTMRTDSLDRFGTRLEHRFTRDQIALMMKAAGLERVRFREGIPYWVACGRRR